MNTTWKRLLSLGQSQELSLNENRRIAVVNRIAFPFAVVILFNALLFLAVLDVFGFLAGFLVVLLALIPVFFNHHGSHRLSFRFFIPLYSVLLLVIAFTIGRPSNIEFGFFLVLMAVSIFTDKSSHQKILQVLSFFGFVLVNVIYRNTIPVFIHPFPVLGSIVNGFTIGLITYQIIRYFRDETERSEQNILSSREKYRSLVIGAMDAVVMVNEKGYITGWNKKAELIFGYTQEETKHKLWYQLIIPNKFHSLYHKGFFEAAHTGKSSILNRRKEILGIRKNGKEFPMEISVVAHEHEGKFVFNAFLRDIKDKKEAEAKLVSINQELSQFASVASHDMKEPLRTIGSFSDLLVQRIPENKETTEYLFFIKDAAKRMTRLLEDLISYAKAGHNFGAMEKIDLNEIIKMVKNNLYNLMETNGATIECKNLPTILAQETPLIQLFQNLIGNSIKYTNSEVKPVVKIHSLEQEKTWEITISDNGIGMKQEYLTQIFEPFTRLQTHDKYEGSGIGLAVCKKIVERYKGKIWAESELGKGTVFYLQLPKMVEKPKVEMPRDLVKVN